MNYLAKALLLILITSPLSAQNEFGAVGSYWNYTHAPHSGNGYGWETILVERDTLINGKPHQLLSRSYSRTVFFPEFNTVYEYEMLGTMLIENDSVYVNDRLILDFSMEAGDTLTLDFMEGTVTLVADSITTEIINGIDHKKWNLQKLCPNGNEEFVEVLEGVGPIGAEYLLWNMDGCTLIGGGINSFSCYQNGDFNYPETTGCEILVKSDELNPATIKIHPNPANDFLMISSEALNIATFKIFDAIGKVVLENYSLHTHSIHLDISEFSPGMYHIELGFKNSDKRTIKKLIKK